MFCDSPICGSTFSDIDTYVVSNGEIFYFNIDIQEDESFSIEIQEDESFSIDIQQDESFSIDVQQQDVFNLDIQQSISEDFIIIR